MNPGKKQSPQDAPPRRGLLRRFRRRPLSPAQRKKRRALRFGLLGAAVLLIVLALLFFNNSDEARYERYLKRASASYQAGEYDSALSDLRRAAAIDNSRECLMLMVDCYEANGNLELARETLRQMDTNDPKVSARLAAIEDRLYKQGEAVYVTVSGTQLSPELTTLVLDDRGITDANLSEIRQLRALNELSLQNNAITSVAPLSSLGGLSSLDLRGNRIEDVSPLASLTGLRTLYLDGNPIADLRPLYALSELRLLSIRGLTVSEEALAELAAALPGCAIYTGRSEAVSDITLGGVTFRSDVTSLRLSGLGIQDISALAECRELKTLDLSGNEIVSLTPLMNLPSLEWLNIADNEVSDLLPLMGIHTLRRLNAANNQILDASGAGALRGLTTLDLSGNPLGDLSGLASLSNLTALRLAQAGITDEELAGLESMCSLLTLDLEGNEGLSDASMSRLHNALPNCAIVHDELIYTVELAGHSFPSDISELKLGGLGIEDLTGLERFSALVNVDLSGNDLYNVIQLQFSPCRLTLRSLNLSCNKLSDIGALSSLGAIEELDLSFNQIESVQALMKLTTLRRLDLTGNAVSEEDLAALRAALPDCKIISG